MQQELLQFKIQNVWVLVDYPNGIRLIKMKWVLKNKKDERGIVIRNKARLVAQGHTQEERFDYEEVFAPAARIEAIRLFLAYASYMGFIVYQMDVKSAFLYRTINEEKTEHNTDFHQIVDFLEASHIRQWTVSGSSIRRHLKLNDEEVPQGEDSEHPSEPHHTPSDQDKPIHHEQITQSHQHAQITSHEPITQFSQHEQTTFQEPTIPSQSHSVITTPTRITRGTIWISQSKVPSLGPDKTAFTIGDVRYGEAFPTVTRLDAGQDRQNIPKTFTMPHEASPRVTSLGGDEGKERRIYLGGCSKHEGRDQGEDLLVGDTMKNSDKSADKGSDSTDDMSNVLGTLGVVNILASGGFRLVFTTASLSVATASTIVSLVIATASGGYPTVVIFTTASVATPNTRVTRSSRRVVIESSSLISVNIPSITKKDKGKGKMTEPKQPSKKKRDSEIARIYAEREFKMMIAELDRSNDIVAKYLSEYEQAKAGLSHDEKVELIDELFMYQRNLVQIKKYQAQQTSHLQ
nr:retrovirus-related Pol polyprotein from transposon TNT 1-94 [Tanacetum cinerariifolium]